MASSSNLLDIFTKLITALECPVCYEYVSSPIYQCNSGHILCNKCITSIYLCPTCRSSISPSSSRVRSIEHISDFMIFPCRNEGCEEILPLKELRSHENSCRHANAFGGTMNENYKHTSLKHKLFLHVEQHIAPFFVTSPSVANVDVCIQTEYKTGLTAEASTSTNFPPEKVGPYLMYGIMQPTEQVLQLNEVLPCSNQQFCGLVSPSSALIDKNFDPSSIVKNFTDLIKKNAQLLNSSSSDVGNLTSSLSESNDVANSMSSFSASNDIEKSRSSTLFGTASSLNSRTVKNSQSVDKLNSAPKDGGTLVTNEAKILIQNQVSSSSTIMKNHLVKPSCSQTLPRFPLTVNTSGNNSLFLTDPFRNSVNSPRKIKIPSFRKLNRVTKSDESKGGVKLKFFRSGPDSHFPSLKSNRKKFSQNTSTIDKSNPFSFQGLSDELSRAQNVFVFSGFSNSTTTKHKLPAYLGPNVTKSESNAIFTNSNSSLDTPVISSNFEHTSDLKELNVQSSSTSTIAARPCETSVTFSLNSSISSPVASTSGTIPEAINPPLLANSNVTKYQFSSNSLITSQSNSNTSFCNSEIKDAFSNSAALVTSNSQFATAVSDGKLTSLITKASFSFGVNSSATTSSYSTIFYSKIPVSFNPNSTMSSTLNSTSAVNTNPSSLNNMFTTNPTKLENNSKASSSFNHIAVGVHCSKTPISTSVSLFKNNSISSKICTNTSVDFPGNNQNSTVSSSNTSSSSSSNLSIFTPSQVNFPHTSSSSPNLSTTSPLFSNFLKQFNRSSTEVKGFSFSLNSAPDPLSFDLHRFAFSKRPNVTITSENIFVFGQNSKSS